MVLSYINDNRGAATTHDITTDTVIDDNDIARYQLEKLEKEGFVQLGTVEEGHFTVTQAQLTEEGQRWMDNTYEDRLNQLEDRLDKTRDALRAVIEKLDEEDIVSRNMEVTRKYS